MNYSIGEFSRITRITVKALRLYHDKELLVPDFVDRESGYRYYAADQVNEARVIQKLKEMGFSLGEIKDALASCEEDGELIDRLEAKRRELEMRVGAFRRSIAEIELLISSGAGRNAEESEPDEVGVEVEEKLIPDMLIAGLRMRGRYAEVGKGFQTLMRTTAGQGVGRPMCLYYDSEYREEGADFEPALQVRSDLNRSDVDCRLLQGGRALMILHKGPYERLGESYRKLFDVVKREGLELRIPSREI